MIEGQQPLFGERREKLKHEERVARGLAVHELRERRNARRFATKPVGNQPPDLFLVKGPELDLANLRPAALNGCELPRQRMVGVDLVVPVGADQQQMSNVRLGHQVLKQIERRRVQPLQIVEK